jgi:hypothetical protein
VPPTAGAADDSAPIGAAVAIGVAKGVAAGLKPVIVGSAIESAMLFPYAFQVFKRRFGFWWD